MALVDFDRAVRELGDSFRDKLKKPTAEQTAVFTKFAEQALAVRTVLQNTAATKAAEEFETLRASLTPTVIDDFRVKLAKLRKELSEKFAPDQVEDLLGFEEALAKVAIGLETIEGRIAQVKSTAISSLDAQLGLMGLLQEVEAQLSKLETVEALAGGSEQSAIVIAGLRAQIAKLQQEIAAAGGNGPSNDDLRNQDQAQVKAQRLGRSIEDISRLTLTAADAFGVLSDEAAKALAATIDVAAGLGRIIAGDAAGGAAQLASGAISLIAGAVGKDPATEQRQREHVENLEVLRNIAKNTGDLLGISASGKSIAGVRDAVGLLLANTGNAGGFRRFGDAGPLRDVNEASFLEFQTGLSFKEIEALAKSLGITLNGTKQSYVDFLNALKRLDLEAITKGFSGQLRRLEIEARLDPTAFEGIEGLIKRLRVLTDQTDGAPAIARAIGDLDSLRTSEGRAAAIARLTETLRNISSLDVSDLGGLSLDQFIEEILAAIERLREMDPAAKKAGERFNDAMEAWGVAVELGTMTAEQRLQKIKDFVRLNFSGLNDEAFAALDFSSLDAMDASIAKIIDAFAADGELSDAEKEQIAMLRAVREAYKSTIPEAQKFSDALGVLQDRFAIFGTSAIDQFTALADALGEQFPSIGELLQGLDLKTDPQALDTLKARAQAIFDALAEGGVTTEEQAIIDAIKQILEAAADAADEIARDAADRLAAESARRQAILDRAETRIRLNDVTDPAEQLRIRVAALSEAFPALAAILGDFDVSTQDGRDAMEAWIQAIAGSPETLESLAAAMGVSVDELLSALVGLEDGADAAATKVATLAEKLGAAFDAADFETELEGITDPLEKLRRSAAKVSDVMPELAALFKQFDVSTAQGRAGAEAALIALGKSTTDADVQRAVLRLLAQIRSVPVVGPSALQGTKSGSSGAAAASSANIAAAASITEVTANRLVDLFGRNVVATEQIRDALAGNLARALSPVPTVRAPLLPSQVAEQWGACAARRGSRLLSSSTSRSPSTAASRPRARTSSRASSNSGSTTSSRARSQRSCRSPCDAPGSPAPTNPHLFRSRHVRSCSTRSLPARLRGRGPSRDPRDRPRSPRQTRRVRGERRSAPRAREPRTAPERGEWSPAPPAGEAPRLIPTPSP
ncbi:MAG: hypothetical protein IPF47_14515 [Gemmatimonadetes bacterium]|nr:hypothetical protein [Gemmatimonadota bacterium]